MVTASPGPAVRAMLSGAGAWEGLEGQPVGPDGQPLEKEEERVPAWLWISIALAGCSFVVLSAYLGLLLPR